MAYDSTSVMIGLLSSLDDKGFKAAQSEAKKMGLDLQRASDTGTVSMNKLEAGSAKLRAGFVETAMKIGMVWMSLKKMVDASIEQHRADVQLRLAIKNNTDEYSRQGMTIDQLTKKLKEYAGAREDATGIDDAATQQQMKLLLSMGVLPNQVERVTNALQDMAAGTDISVETMARAWGRLQEAPEEALGALSRAGVKIRKEQLDGMTVEQQRIFILEKLEEKFKGQAKAMYEASGDVGKASTAINNAIESIGDAIMPAIGAVASVVAEVAKAFNGLPAPVRGAVVAIGGAITMFLSGPIGMVAGAIATLGGLISMFRKVPFDMNAVKDANSSLKKSLDDFSASTTEAQRSTMSLMDKLRGTKQGTSEYENLVRQIIALNPKLAESNISVASSYNQIANALGNASVEMQRKAALDASDKAINVAKKLSEELKTNYARMNDMSIGDSTWAREYRRVAQIKYEAGLAEFNALRKNLSTSAKLTGIDYNKKFMDAIIEGIAPDFSATNSKRALRLADEIRIAILADADRAMSRGDQNAISRNNYATQAPRTSTGGAASDKTPYDITALMRQLEALKNINQYGEQAGNLINQLTEANNRYEDEVKKINSETHKSEADKQKALKAAADLRDEEIKRIKVATEAALTMADVDREMALESNEHKRRRLEIMKQAQDEIQKISDDEAKATALLSQQLAKKVITQDQYESQRAAVAKKYADAKLATESKMNSDLNMLFEMQRGDERQKEQDRLDDLAEQKRKELEILKKFDDDEAKLAREWDLEKDGREDDLGEYDLEALRRRWETEFNIKSDLKRELFQIEVEYLDELVKLEKRYSKDSAEYKAAQSKLTDIKQKKETDARYKAEISLIDTISGYYSSAMSIARGDVASGMQGLLSQLGQQTQTAWLGWAAFGVGVLSDFFGLFGSKSESVLDKMKKQLQSIMDEMDRVSDKTGVGLAEKIFGADSSKYSAEALRTANEAVRVWREANPLLAWMDDEQIYEFRKKLFGTGGWLAGIGNAAMKDLMDVGKAFPTDQERLNNAMGAYNNFAAQIKEKYGDDWQAVMQSLGMRMDVGTSQFNNWLLDTSKSGKGFWYYLRDIQKNGAGIIDALVESAGKAAEALQLLDDAKVRDALATYKEQLADIDHRLKTGKLTDEEAIKSQLDVYDQMLLQIESLDESTEKEAARNKLLEERYALEQNLLALQNKEKDGLSELLATEQGRAIQAKMDELEKIQRMIEKGQLSDNMANAVVQQDLYRQIIAGLKSLGADKSVIQDWEDKLIALVKGKIGENQYNALSGTGSQVLLSNGVVFDTEEVKKTGQRALARAQNQVISARARAEVESIEGGIRRAMAMVEMPTPSVNLTTETKPTKIQQFHVNMQLPNDMIGYIMRAIKNQTGHNTWPSGRG